MSWWSVSFGDALVGLETKLVLITSKEAEEARQAFIKDENNGNRAAECKRAFREVVVVDDYDNGGEVEVQAFRLHVKHRFSHVIVFTENDLIRGARIRQMLNIKTGQSVENAIRYRDKVLMKEICVKHGVKTPIFSAVESASDVISFTSQHDFPVVVKPKMGYSSVNTTVLKDRKQMEEFCIQSLTMPGVDPIYGLEVEKFVNGPMYHIDGLVLDGKMIICWPSLYKGTVMQFQTNPYIAGYSLSPSNPLVERLSEFIESVINALGSDPHPNPSTFPFHAEAWHTPDDEIVLCEIASRGGGGNIKKQFQELFQLNMDEIWTEAQCKDQFPTKFEDKLEDLNSKEKVWKFWTPVVDHLIGWIYIYPKCGTVESFPIQNGSNWEPALPEYCLHFQLWLTKGQSYAGPKDCADTCCAALVKGSTEEEVLQNIQNINDWFFANSTWVAK